MNLKNEALKMAIEALDTLMMEKGSIYQQALNACKEALEQPAQEPVAWIYQSNSGHPALRWENTTSFDYDSIAKKQPDIPLYTHPAQPLSLEEIDKIFLKHGVMFLEGNYALVRAIEQAHGIV